MIRDLTPVIEYYEAKLAAFGCTPRGVDWKDEASQRTRFEQLLRAADVPRDRRFTIVDYGCGYGALVPFMTERGFAFDYTGYDRSPRMIEQARREHGPAFTFTSDWNDVPASDYVVCSGVFNVRLEAGDEEWLASVLETLAEIHAKASRGWAANFLTMYSDPERMRADLYYANPAILLDWCRRNASRWVSILHDYDLYEFTVGVLRAPRNDGKHRQ